MEVVFKSEKFESEFDFKEFHTDDFRIIDQDI